MKDYIFADALAQSLQADPRGGFTVQRVISPEEVEQYSRLRDPYAVLMEVTHYSPCGLEDRLKIRDTVKKCLYPSGKCGFHVAGGSILPHDPDPGQN